MIRQGAKVLSRVVSKKALVPVLGRSLSSLEKKGLSDEARYFAAADAEKINAMKAKFEDVVSKGNAEEVEALMEHLGK